MVQNQIKKAQGFFYAESKVVLCKEVPCHKKVCHYSRYVVPVAFHGCGAWICNRGVLKQPTGYETSCLKQMLRLGQKKDQIWVQWHRLATTASRTAFRRIEKKSLPIKYLERLFKFVATTFLGKNDSAPLAMFRSILNWRSTLHLRSCQMIAEPTSKHWKHQARGNLRVRWDEVFVECMCDEWVETSTCPRRRGNL